MSENYVSEGEEVKQKFTEGIPKICSGCYSVPAHNFSRNFQNLSVFFSVNANFFPLKFDNSPAFLQKIQIYLSFDPLTKDIFSVFGSLFRDIRLFNEF